MLRIVKCAVPVVNVALTTLANAAWPEHPVALLVPFAPSGLNDVLARLTAERPQASLNRTFIVVNEPGAAGIDYALRLADWTSNRKLTARMTLPRLSPQAPKGVVTSFVTCD